MRTLLRLGTVLTVFLGVSLVALPMSQAVEVPETLADRRPVGAGPVEPDFPIDYLGVLWETRGVADEHAADEAEEHGAVRFRVDGAWTAWQPLTEDGAHAEGQWGSALVAGGDAEAYQVRGLPEHAIAPRAVALNTTDGPLVEVGRRPAGGAHALPTCLSRAEWGADESLRFDAGGTEIWPATFSDVQTMTVHHTATKNDDPDPDATVRAIYRYHAVDLGWGDIGYHYLLDEQGRVYEGRWSGSASTPCGTSGGGSDFAHDDGNKLVTAGHTGGYNTGNMGAALLGNFTTSRKDGAEPEPVAVDALEGLLAEFADRHGLDPKTTVDYVNPENGYTKTVDMISAHRDWKSTECPGDRLYDDLPAIRDAVMHLMAPAVTLTSPTDGAKVSGQVTLAADSLEATSVTFLLGGTALATDGDGTDGWAAQWNSGSVADGTYTLTASASDGVATGAHSVSITVDNVAQDPLDVTAMSPRSAWAGQSVGVEVTGSGFAAGARLELLNGSGTAPTVSNVIVVSAGTITATVTVPKGGKPGSYPWDVVVTNTTDGISDVLDDGFTVLR